jgi:hypothetical protein
MELTIHFICPDCPADRLVEAPESESASLPRVLEPDPGWHSEIDWPLEETYLTEMRVFARCRSRETFPKDFFLSLDRMRKALLHQKSHLLETTPEQPMKLNLNVSEGCICGKTPDEEAESEAGASVAEYHA